MVVFLQVVKENYFPKNTIHYDFTYTFSVTETHALI